MLDWTSYAADTIAAVATPPGMGGIAIVRVSGPDARQVAASVFRPARRHRMDGSSPEHRPGWRAVYGRVYDSSGEFIDEAIMLSMPGPASYTREDVVELSCHGGRRLYGRCCRRYWMPEHVTQDLGSSQSALFSMGA